MNLNLAYPDRSKIKYKIINYPDGQNDIKIDVESITESKSVSIISRFNNFIDLELILCATTDLKNLGFTDIRLFIPYLLGARSDRYFTDGGTSYLKDIIAPIINSMCYSRVNIQDPHSDVAPALLSRCGIIPNTDLIKFACEDAKPSNVVVIAPDGGALKRAYSAAKIIDATEVIACDKHRDVATGKILETIVRIVDFKGRDVFIVDDICDGGRTFIEISKILQHKNCGRIFLIVTHGIFSQGFKPLEPFFTRVYCTNSVKEVNDPLVRQVDTFKLIEELINTM